MHRVGGAIGASRAPNNQTWGSLRKRQSLTAAVGLIDSATQSAEEEAEGAAHRVVLDVGTHLLIRLGRENRPEGLSRGRPSCINTGHR
jgi:hypothetical protein